MIKIRNCNPADAALVADLSRQTFYETFASYNSAPNMEKFMGDQFSREKLMKELDAPGNYFFLAIEGDRPVGYVRMRNSTVDELGNPNAIEIARIYALKDAIGKGVGSLLMQNCLDIAMNEKKEVIWLGVWEKNERAIAFYQRWGFEKFGTHIFQLGDDPQTDWLMKKELLIK